MAHRQVPETNRQFAKSMRTTSTDAEARLWRHLRAGRLGDFKFKRQVPVGAYILDFVCFERKLVVEVDGSQHADAIGDRDRDTHLAALGFTTLRIWNSDVFRNTEGVLLRILTALRSE